MKTKNEAKGQAKNVTNCTSIRITKDVQRKLVRIVVAANKKITGRKIKINEVLSLAADLVTDEHLKTLQDQALTNEDRKEILRQKYIASRGPISKDEFTGFMMTDAFQDFVCEQNKPKSVSIS